MTGIRNALTRKFGPLPAWAWLTILAAGAYFYSSRGGGGGAAPSTSATDITPTDAPEPRDPMTLQPGESVYDPNTGQLIGTAPEQQPAEVPEAVAPFLPDPVEAPEPAFEPAAAAAAPPAAKKPSALSRAKAAVLTGRVGPINRQRLRSAGYSDSQIDYHAKRKTAVATPQSKKKPKAKPQHKPSKPVKHPTPNKSKPRKGGTLKKPVVRTKHKPPAAHAPKPTRARAKPKAPAPSRTRAKTPAAKKPVTRQRPAPSHTTPRKKGKKK